MQVRHNSVQYIHWLKCFIFFVGETSNSTATESEGLVAESSDPLWGQTPPASSEVEHTDTVDSNLQLIADNGEVFNAATSACGGFPFKIKQEEGEVEIVQVKEEPVETASSDCPRIELCQQTAEAGVSLELPLTQQCPQISCSSVTEPGFTGVDPSTCKLKLSILSSPLYSGDLVKMYLLFESLVLVIFEKNLHTFLVICGTRLIAQFLKWWRLLGTINSDWLINTPPVMFSCSMLLHVRKLINTFAPQTSGRSGCWLSPPGDCYSRLERSTGGNWLQHWVE